MWGIVLRWFCVPKAPGRSWALYWVLRRLRKSVVSAVRFRTLLLFAVVFCLCLDSGLRWIDSCRKSPRPKTWSDWGPYLHTTVSLHYTYMIFWWESRTIYFAICTLLWWPTNWVQRLSHIAGWRPPQQTYWATASCSLSVKETSGSICIEFYGLKTLSKQLSCWASKLHWNYLKPVLKPSQDWCGSQLETNGTFGVCRVRS